MAEDMIAEPGQPTPEPRGWPDHLQPGSDAAREAGCRCPVIDNNRGRRAPVPPHGWFIHLSCPVHGKGFDQGEQHG